MKGAAAASMYLLPKKSFSQRMAAALWESICAQTYTFTSVVSIYWISYRFESQPASSAIENSTSAPGAFDPDQVRGTLIVVPVCWERYLNTLRSDEVFMCALPNCSYYCHSNLR